MPTSSLARRRSVRVSRALAQSTLYRIWLIHARLCQEEAFTAETLANELRFSVRTLKRDLKRMAQQLGMPVYFDRQRNTYRYRGPCAGLPAFCLTRRDSLVLAFLNRVWGSSPHSALAKQYRALFEKLAPLCGQVGARATTALETVLSLPFDAVREAEFEHVLDLIEAACERRVLLLTYQKPGERARPRLVHPLHLREAGGRWMLLAFDVASGAVRRYLLMRIRRFEPTGATFTPPTDFEPAPYFESALHRYGGTGNYEVRLALAPIAAARAQELDWHPSQRLTTMRGRRTTMLLRLGSLVEIQSDILRWAGHVEVLAPPELRTAVREAHLQAARLHGG